MYLLQLFLFSIEFYPHENLFFASRFFHGAPFEESLRSDCESFDDEPGSNAVPACSFYPPAILPFLSISTSPLRHLLDEGSGPNDA